MRQFIRKYWMGILVLAILALDFTIGTRNPEASGILTAALIAYMIHDHMKQGGQSPQ